MQTVTPTFLDVNGLSVHYRLEGATDGPVVMLCHGLLGSLSMWQPQIKALAARYRVLRYDNRGHGLTTASPAPYTVEQLAGDAVGLLDVLDIARVHFVGCSLGGMIGQCLAARHANRVESLVLVGSRSAMPPASMWEERIGIARSEGVAALLPTMLERWFTSPFRTSVPAAVRAVADDVLTTPVEGFVGACMAIRDMDHRALLSHIVVPTLVTSGDHDPGVPVEDTRFIHATVPGAEVTLVQGARHLLSIERAAEFNSLLLDWLARH
jgi:3-oxoadipate enol-lactonase